MPSAASTTASTPHSATPSVATFSTTGYAAHSPTSGLGLFTFERRQPRANDVLIEISYCGVCHSDVHCVHNDWGSARYPMVPGHEIVGRVLQVGEQVTRFKVGDRVGVGCMVDACRHCTPCRKGWQQYCESGATYTYNHRDRIDGLRTYGGYSEKIVVTEDFVLKIPDALELPGAAPLLCAGITMYAPLRQWQAGPGKRVAIVGLGGLGHMGLKLARAMGAEVTLITRSPGKEQDARSLGASQVLISSDAAQMQAAAGQFDLIVDTVPYQHDVNPYLPLLATGGTLVMVGYMGPQEPPLNTSLLVFGNRALAGSLIGGIAQTQEMLDFCGQHGIHADIELIPIQAINQAYERMLRADVHYRFVIDMASLQQQ